MFFIKQIDAHIATVLHGKTAGRLQRLLQSPLGLWVIAAISFFESALPVPLVTDPFMVAGILANRSRATLIVVVTTISSIIGGLAAFLLASFFFSVIAQYMTPDMQADFASLVSFGASDTFVATVAGAITPIPYTITAWVIAVAGGGAGVFILGSLVGRTIRYAIVGYCTYAFGPAALTYARRSLTLTSLVVFALLVVYVIVKL